MSEILTALEFNGATGVTVEREFTAKDVAELEAIKVQAEEIKAEAEAKATARESALAKLAALGLTADEVAAL